MSRSIKLTVNAPAYTVGREFIS